MALLVQIRVSQAGGSPHYETTREGAFDESSEKLLGNLEKLRLGMTPKEVRKQFPEHVTWRLHATDRNFAMEVCFQWQDEGFFWAAFNNTMPTLNGQYHTPGELSDARKLQSAGIMREKVKIEDGYQIMVETFEKPSVSFTYKKPKDTEQE